MDLYELLSKSKIRFIKDLIINHSVNNLVTSSKEAGINDLFIAIKGEINDGHDFIVDVINKNVQTIIYEDPYYDYLHFDNINLIRVKDTKKALAILASSFYGEPSKKVNLIGVTGTNGKTTVSTLISKSFNLLGEKCTLIGTTGINMNGEFYPTENTTPQSLILQKMIYTSLNKEIKNVVMEVSSHSIKQERISQLDFNTIIYTNFSHDHLDYHKTVDDYFYTKGLLFSSLGNFFNEKKVLFNGDDKYYKRFMRLTNVESYTYGIGKDNDFQARDIVCDVDKIIFQLFCFDEFIGYVDTNNIFGFYNVYNLLAILAYFYLEGYDMKKVLSVMPQLSGAAGRMEKVKNDFSLNVFVDYAHTPESVYRVLKEVKLISKRKIICVIGCGGDRDSLKRPQIGRITTSLADVAIFTSDNPRNEAPENIIENMIEGASKDNYLVIIDRSEAIKQAIEIMDKNDCVIILGKGHENYQIIKDQKRYFSDTEEALRQINNRFKAIKEF